MKVVFDTPRKRSEMFPNRCPFGKLVSGLPADEKLDPEFIIRCGPGCFPAMTDEQAQWLRDVGK